MEVQGLTLGESGGENVLKFFRINLVVRTRKTLEHTTHLRTAGILTRSCFRHLFPIVRVLFGEDPQQKVTLFARLEGTGKDDVASRFQVEPLQDLTGIGEGARGTCTVVVVYPFFCEYITTIIWGLVDREPDTKIPNTCLLYTSPSPRD